MSVELAENVRIYQQSFLRLLKSKKMLFKALLKFCNTKDFSKIFKNKHRFKN